MKLMFNLLFKIIHFEELGYVQIPGDGAETFPKKLQYSGFSSCSVKREEFLKIASILDHRDPNTSWPK